MEIQHLQEEPYSAQSVRVSPQELVAAVTELEKEKDAAALRHSDTVAIGQAINDLGLSHSADEVLAAIEVHRQRVAIEQANKRVSRHKLIALWTAMLVFAAVTVLDAVRNLRNDVPATPVVASTIRTPTRSPVLKPLSSVPDGMLVHVDFQTLQRLGYEQNANDLEKHPDMLVDARQEIPDTFGGGVSDMDNLWPIVKKNGHVFVPVMTSAPDSISIANGHAGRVFNHSLGKAKVQIDVPVDRFGAAYPYSFSDEDRGHVIGVELLEAKSNP